MVSLMLAGLLLASGCSKKSDQQTAATNPQAQPAAQNPPAPPQDQSAQPAAAPAAPAAAPTSSAAVPADTTAAQSAPAAPAPTVLVIPVRTHLRVRLDQDLGSKISQPGQAFGATVADPVIVDGQTVIPRGAHATGTVVDAKPLGHFKGGALLALRIDRVRTNWGSYPVETSTMERAEQGKGKRTAGFIGGGAGLGAIIGGIAGGGKGALIGGLVGGGAGTAGSAMTGNKQIFLPSETLLTFRLERPVHVTAQ
ncbi:hypothetical protein [Paracidobacterium acidisoli]|uniref:hypothetical protein n=1 Tax=Paracidobacterium acidisoli TaxID=2303751 RepID=UPI0018F1E7BD|nr:hypothetical protein [Paracidobacterium acidisoli]MBT9331176.1 hypothetical protein [Paracidobacterium acidisoli]